MPVNGQTIGKDTTVSFVFNGVVFDVSPNAITQFSAMPVTSEESRLGLDGFSRHAVFPESWKGGFEIDRLDPTVDTFWAGYENLYYSGANTGSGTIQETIQNPDGSISEFLYTGVVYKLDNTGERVADKIQKQSLSWLASRRKQIQ